MMQLACELCGGTDLIKQNGVFICQTCGCKYSLEEARRLMMDGDAKITAPVNVLNSGRIEKLLINARRAFSDRNYSEAQRLFAEVLNEDTENAEAILYQGLSIGWQGNAVKYTMDRAGEAAKRALEIKHSVAGDSPEFERFVMEALEKIVVLSIALADLCNNYMREAINTMNKAIEENTRELHELPFGVDPSYLKRDILDRETRMKEEINRFKKVRENTILIALSTFEKAVGMLENVDSYSLQIFDIILSLLTKLRNYAEYEVTLSKINSIATTINEYKRQLNDTAGRARRKAVAAYWDSHREEWKQLEDELRMLSDEKRKLEVTIKVYSDQEEAIKMKMSKKGPLAEDAEFLRERIQARITEKDKLGVFRGKEKKDLEERIIGMQTRLTELEPLVEKEKADLKNECEGKMHEIRTAKMPHTERLKAIEERIALIIQEMTKDRPSTNVAEASTDQSVNRQLSNNIKFCGFCGAKIMAPGARFCSVCGNKL